jgi:mannose/fructose/N-acetylgalactosamine-specific phosphotransferase system component IIC
MEITTLLSIPAIIALVEAIKRTEYINDRYVPLVSILAGLGIGFLMGDYVSGLVMGLAASGTWSSVKHVTQ